MSRLSLDIMEILGLSLGVDQAHYRAFFEGNDSIMRLNYYPPCQKPEQTLGTGPHCDPTSLTILHQDDVAGLQVYIDGKWRTIRPRANAFVVNIGDTFMVNLVALIHRYIYIYKYFCSFQETVTTPFQSILLDSDF